eukprot:9044559-Pyramimonas_sp.AAC.1
MGHTPFASADVREHSSGGLMVSAQFAAEGVFGPRVFQRGRGPCPLLLATPPSLQRMCESMLLVG